KNDVAAGQKPTLTVTAVDKVLDVKLDLTRDDGEKFAQKLPALEPGKQAVLPVGDGKPGKSHWSGSITPTITGERPGACGLSLHPLVRAPMTINYDYDHLDLAGRVLKFQQSRAAGKAELTVIADDGEEMGAGTATYRKEPPGTWLAIKWSETRAA